LAASQGGRRGKSPEVAGAAGGRSFGQSKPVDVIGPACNGGKYLVYI